MLNNKIISAVLVCMVGVSSLSAQDDVSIMDLKETVYYLMKDVRDMKKTESKFLLDAKKVSSQNIGKIKSLEAEIKQLKADNKELRKREILSNYRVSSELENFTKK